MLKLCLVLQLSRLKPVEASGCSDPGLVCFQGDCGFHWKRAVLKVINSREVKKSSFCLCTLFWHRFGTGYVHNSQFVLQHNSSPALLWLPMSPFWASWPAEPEPRPGLKEAVGQPGEQSGFRLKALLICSPFTSAWPSPAWTNILLNLLCFFAAIKHNNT